MKLLNRWVICALMAVMVGCSQPAARPMLVDVDGQQIDTSKLNNKWLFVNYWAAWCLPCAQEVPELNRFYAKHKNKDALVVGVNFDGLPPAELKQAMRKLGIRFPVLTHNPAQALGLGSVPGLPTTYVIAPNGKVKKVLYGDQTLASLEKALPSSKLVH